MKRKFVLYGAGIALMLSNMIFPPFDPLLGAMADCLARRVGQIALQYLEQALAQSGSRIAANLTHAAAELLA